MKQIRSIIISATILSMGMAQEIAIHGVARDNAGAAISDGSHTFTFRLYDALTDGNEVWDEAKTLTVTNGVFETNLGSDSSMAGLNFYNDYWLSVQIGTNSELSPRTKLNATEYGIMAQLNSATNAFPSSGSTGIGTSTPDEELSVVGRVRGAYDANETEYTEIFHDGGHGHVNTVGDGNLDFRHEGNTRLSLTSNGDLGIGTQIPQEKLHINNGNIYFGEGGDQNGNGRITWSLNDNGSLYENGHWLGYKSGVDAWWMILQGHQSEGVRIRTAQDGDIMIVGGSDNDQTDIGKGVKVVGDLRLDGRFYHDENNTNNKKKDWTMIDFDNFDDNNEGWSGSSGNNNGRSNCGGSIYGGYNRAGSGSVLYKEITPPSGYRYIKVEMEVYMIDSWDDERFYGTLTGNVKRTTMTYKSESSHHSVGVNRCGNSYKDRSEAVMFTGEWDGSGSIRINVLTGLSGGWDDESIGIDNVAIYMR